MRKKKLALGLAATMNPLRALTLPSRIVLAAGAMGGVGTSVAVAATVIQNGGDGGSTATGTGSVAGGNASTATGAGAVAIGNGASTTQVPDATNNPNPSSGVAIGNNARSTYDGSIAIGQNTAAAGSYTPGNPGTFQDQGFTDLRNVGGTVPINNAGGATTFRPSGVAIGELSTVLTGGGVAIGYNNRAGTGAASPNASVAVGTNNLASGIYATSLGLNNIASGTAAMALGVNNQAVGARALAFGRQSYAIGDFSIAQGSVASAYGPNGIALGASSVAGVNGGGQAGDVALGAAAAATGGTSLALGTGATAANAGAVALGANSVTAAAVGTSNASIAGTTYGFAGTAPASTVSLGGNAGAVRTITNLAAGRLSTASTDAVNGSQLAATNTAVTAVGAQATTLGNSVAAALGGGSAYTPGTGVSAPGYSVYGTLYNTVGGAVTALQTAAPLQYSNAAGTPTPQTPGNNVTLVGATAGAPVTLHDVAPGALTATSTDAVNGAQLAATNTGVTNNANAISAINNGAGIKYFHANSTAADSNAAGVNSVAIGPTATAAYAGAVALGSGSATGAAAPTAAAYATGAAAPASEVSIGTANAQRRLTNLSAGAAATDAVNVSQLNSVGNSLGATLGSSFNAATGTYAAPSYVTAAGTAATTVQGALTNETAAITGLGNATTAKLGGGTSYNPATGGIDGGFTVNGVTYASVANAISGAAATGGPFVSNNAAGAAAPVSSGANASAGGYGARATGAASTVVGNAATDNGNAGATILGNGASVAAALAGSNVAIGQGTAATRGALAGYTGFGLGGPQTSAGQVAVGTAAAPRQITGVAAGSAATDAVNVSQLGAVGGDLATSLGGGAAFNPTTGAYTAPAYTVAGTPYATVGGALTALDSGLSGGQLGAFRSDNTAGAAAPAATGANSAAGGFGSSATGAASTALGNGATDNGNAGATVLGNGSAVAAGLTGSNVALGQGSRVAAAAVPVAGTSIGATAYAFAGAAPAGAVSIGTAGAERQIQNVAAGQLTAGSTNAVNGSQLFATNTEVAANTLALSTINNGGGIRYFRANSALPDAVAGGTDSVAIGPAATTGGTASNAVALGNGANAAVSDGLALGSGSLSNRALAPTSGSVTVGTGFVPFNTATGTLLGAVSVGNEAAATYRQITNVADGTAAQDAVTLRQLAGALGSLSATGTLYFHANPGDPNAPDPDSLAVGSRSVAVGPNSVANGDNGIGIGNGAVVGIFAPGGVAIGQGARTNLGDSLAVGTNAVGNALGGVALGAGAQVNNAASVALGANATTSVGAQANYAAFGLGAPQNSAGEVSLGSAGLERKITNVAAGSAATDAANLGQLAGAAANLGTSVAGSLGGGSAYGPASGRITAPTYTLDNGTTTVNTVGGALSNLDGRTTANTNSIAALQAGAGGGGIRYFHANSTAADSTPAGTDSVAIGPMASTAAGAPRSVALGSGATTAGADSVALGAGSTAGAAAAPGRGDAAALTNASGAATAIAYDTTDRTLLGPVSVGSAGAYRQIQNVADGQAASDAVTVRQLQAGVQSAVTYTDTYAVRYAPDGVTLSSPYAGGPVVIHNIGPGAVTATSTDAVNGAQIYALQQVAANAIQYDPGPGGRRSNTITLAGGDPSAGVLIRNVAPGIAPTDAANVGQVNNLAAYAQNGFDSLGRRISRVDNNAKAGIATAMAAAGLRYDDRPGKLSVSAGAAGYGGNAGLAFGLGSTSWDGSMRLNLAVAFAPTNTRSDVGVSGGFSYTLN